MQPFFRKMSRLKKRQTSEVGFLATSDKGVNRFWTKASLQILAADSSRKTIKLFFMKGTVMTKRAKMKMRGRFIEVRACFSFCFFNFVFFAHQMQNKHGLSIDVSSKKLTVSKRKDPMNLGQSLLSLSSMWELNLLIRNSDGNMFVRAENDEQKERENDYRVPSVANAILEVCVCACVSVRSCGELCFSNCQVQQWKSRV
jgi:hypothetical protein